MAPSARAVLRLLLAALAVCVLLPGAAHAKGVAPAEAVSAQPATALEVISPSVRPTHFRHTAAEAVALARATEQGRRLLAEHAGARTVAYAPDLGLWLVSFEVGGRALGAVQLEDRTGHALEGAGAWSWPQTGSPMSSFKRAVEWLLLGFSVLFVAGMVDRRRLWSLRTLDALALTAGFGVAFLLFDRQQLLVAIPVAVAVLAYLLGRMLAVGLRGAQGGPRWSPPPIPVLVAGLAALVAVRVGFNLLEGPVNDVGYAMVVGADGIIHHYPLYTADENHLDTYGPVAYLLYVPATLIFPMADGWLRDGLDAAHATSIAVDLMTLAMLVVLGRRMRPGRDGTQLGLALAFLFAACPWTFLGMALGTNDGLVGLLLIATLVALRSPVGRGAMLGLATAAKLSPVALLPLMAAGGGAEPRRVVRTVLAFTAVVVLAFLPFMPDGGVRELWDVTLGFQFDRRSFHSLWGQYPELAPLQAILKAAVVGLAAGVVLLPRRRDLAQVAALAAAILLGLQLVVQFWTFVYVGWFVPLVIVALAVREDRVPVEAPERVPERATEPAAARPLPA